MNLQKLNEDKNKILQVYNLNEAARNELKAIHESFCNIYKLYKNSGSIEPGICAFSEWNNNIQMMLNNRHLNTCAAFIYTAVVVARLNYESVPAVQIAQDRASMIGATYEGIISALGTKTDRTPKTKKERASRQERTNYHNIPFWDEPSSGCGGGSHISPISHC